MLNNKYLAVILSIVAVVVVVYQVAFRKPNKPARQHQTAAADLNTAAVPATGPDPAAPPAGTAGLTNTTDPASGPDPTAGTAGTAIAGTGAAGAAGLDNEGAPVIDFNSPILLQRVYENPMEPYPRRELTQQFGKNIFAPPEPEPQAAAGGKTAQKVRFRLDSIIIDNQRQLAVINNKILFSGDTISGAQVLNIRKQNVLIRYKEENILLSTNPGIKNIKLIGGKGDG